MFNLHSSSVRGGNFKAALACLAAFGGVALFAGMCHNARTAADFFGLPPNQVVELGTRVALYPNRPALDVDVSSLSDPGGA